MTPPLMLGIVASNVTKAVVTGGSLFSDATYYYRVFTGSGTMNVSSRTVTADILIMGGGGGGNGNAGNGGSAGALTYLTNQALGLGDFSVTVGNGGARGYFSNDFVSSPGGTSAFASLGSASGGNGGAMSGSSGGSGLGGGGGAAIPNPGGGQAGGAGGAGINTYASWITPWGRSDGYFGGGGGGAGNGSGFTDPRPGGTGGIGGGGAGGQSAPGGTSGGAGQSSTGSGGGAGWSSGGNGGSGFVIVRYLKTLA